MIGSMTQVSLLFAILLGLATTAPTARDGPQPVTVTLVTYTVFERSRGTLAPLPNGKQRTKCQELEGQGQLNEAMHIIGGYHPQCEETGEYKAQQFHYGAGTSWCATPDGLQITPPARGANYDCVHERSKLPTRGATA